ncbi:MAG: crotonobetaine/carnitine-CoA ligase [Gammaproteobacteria bacterium]|jgi:crotonobetaine/carnitine-CoA ligase
MANKFIPSLVPLEHRTLGHVMQRRAQEFEDKIFVETVVGESTSYREMHQRSNRFAHGIAQFGIEFQEPVLVMLPDVIDFLTVWIGFGKRGAVQVPINLAYRKNILLRLCNDSTAKKIIIDRQYLDRLEAIEDELENLECVILYSEDPSLRNDTKLPTKLSQRCRAVCFEALFVDDITDFAPAPKFNDLVAIMYTSGTTGASKGVATTHAHSFAYSDGAGEIFHLTPEDRFYTSGLPLFHIGAQSAVCYASMIYGSTVVLRQGYRNEHFWPDIKQNNCTVVFMLGAIANFIWQQPETPYDIHTPLRKIGMFPVIPEHKAFCKRFGVEISTGYASTECPAPMIHHFDESFPNNQCVGYPTSNFEVKILNEDDVECDFGEMGEICTRPKEPWSILTGYWRQPEYTARAFQNLWYHTGDAGYKDEQGRFYFVDRVTDSMRRRGENISSMEVQDGINLHPDVTECAVFPVWDEYGEQEVMAVIITQPGTDTDTDPEQLIRFLEESMPYFMIPRYIEFGVEIPKTPTGKMEKYKLREIGVTPTTWDRVQAGVKLSR